MLIDSDEPDELDVGQAELGAEEALDDEVLRQPLHEQQADPAEQPDRRQQHLVGPPAGQDLGDVGRRGARRGRREVDGLGRRERRCGSPQSRRLLPGELERDAAGEDRDGDDRQELSLAPSGTRPEPSKMPGSAGAAALIGAAARHRRGRSSRSRTWPSWSSSP